MLPLHGVAKSCTRFSNSATTTNPKLSKITYKSVQAGFRKGRGTRDQIAKIHWIIKKAREIQKNIYFCFIDYAKAFDCVDHSKLRRILKEMGTPDHLTCIQLELDMEQQTGSK